LFFGVNILNLFNIFMRTSNFYAAKGENMKSQAIFRIISAAALLFLWAGPSSAADEAETRRETVQLDEIRVMASPIIEGNVTDKYAGQKTVVSREQIEDLNAQDVSTALRKTPGVNISRFNPVGAFGGGEGGGIFIRGMGSSRPGAEIKTYVDGVPMYMSVWNHPLLDLLAIDSAGAIEVYKSPQPQHFGNAVGIINIVPVQKATPGTQSRIKLAGGSYDTFIGNMETIGKTGTQHYALGGGYRQSDGHRDHADGRTGNFYGNIGYQLSDEWDIRFFGLYSDNTADDPGVKGADPSKRSGAYETRATLAAATLSNNYGSADGYIKVYHNTGEGDWLGQPTSRENVYENLYNDFNYYGIKAREAFRPWNGGELLAGLDWEYTEGDYNKHFTDGVADRWEGHDFTLFSPYAAVSQTLGDETGFHVTPSAGARYYRHSDFDAEWAPHAGLLAAYGGFSWHAGYSRAVVYPGLDVAVFSEKVLPMLGDSWKDLDPEIVDHYETGVSYLFGTLAAVDLTWFYNDGKDRYVVVPPPPPPPVYENIGTYVTKGVETALRVSPTADFSLFFGATFLKSDPDDLPYAPEITLSAGANWRFLNAFTLNLDGQYLDKMRVSPLLRRAGAENENTVDSYFILNGKLSYDFALARKGLSGTVFVAGENITDTDYEYLPGYPMAGINGMAGISLIF
jgi:iron complex outermembrane receptor protein